MRIIEIFHSVQGESSLVGLPTTFVRFARCDLRCEWCDTTYSFGGGEEMSREAIRAVVREAGLRRACLTGGEPLLQKDLGLLCEELMSEGVALSVETGGHRDLSLIPAGVRRIVDLKTPGAFGAEAQASGSLDELLAQTRFRPENLDLLGPEDEIKFVVCDVRELDWVAAVLDQSEILERAGAVHLSPVHGVVDPEYLARWLVEKRLPVRLHLQMHKHVFGSTRRGV